MATWLNSWTLNILQQDRQCTCNLTLWYDMIYLLTAIGLSPGGSIHLHTNNTQNNTNNNGTTQITTNVEECGPCPVFTSFTLAFALQLRKRGLLATVVAVEKQWVSHNLSVCICSLRYLACNAHAPYCHMWPAPLYNIFLHYLINGTILETTILNKNMCFGVLCNFCPKYFFHSKNNCARYDRKCISVLTLRLLMSYMYGAPILDVSRSHTTTQHSR